MESFGLYFRLGLAHITDLAGYDHMLFLAGMTAIWRLRQWRIVLLLVTAFTLGHSLTLALAALGVVRFNAWVIELLIPVTIFATAALNLWRPRPSASWREMLPRYTIVAAFGLIHGLGFSNFFRELLGAEADILGPLLAFNLGVEAGQIGVVLLFLLISWVAVDLLRLRHSSWQKMVSGAVMLVSVWLILQHLIG